MKSEIYQLLHFLNYSSNSDPSLCLSVILCRTVQRDFVHIKKKKNYNLSGFVPGSPTFWAGKVLPNGDSISRETQARDP